MSGWVYVLVIVVLAAVGVLYLRSRRSGNGGRIGRIVDRQDSGQPPRDYAREREADRVSHMSEEDRTWEAASLQKNREAQAREQPPPGTG
jgi:hypothetical protein